MQAKVALVVSIATASVAVGIVSLDLVFTLTSTIDMRQDGSWTTVAAYPYQEDMYSSPKRPFTPGDCAGPDLRVTVDNNRPIGATVDVLVRYTSEKDMERVVVLEETWSLASFESKTYEFVIPATAFPTAMNTTRQVDVEAYLGAPYPLGTCVVQEASR